MIRFKAALLVGSACSLLCASPALAQQGGTSADRQSGASDDTDGGDIIVTAQRREERAIDVPQSISVLSAERLERLNATQFRDFADTVPGLAFTTQGAGYNQITLRGITTGVDSNQTVGTYFDEVPIGSSTNFAFGARLALDPGLFDIDRIEVLRGPQGTLYGASAMGGIIKYVSEAPSTDGFAGTARGGISFTRHGDLNANASGSVNLPIAANAAVRATAYYSRDGGYIDNARLGDEDVNRSNVYGGRLDLLFTPSDAFSIRLTGMAQNIARDGQGTADYSLAGVPVNGPLDQDRFFAEPFDQRFRLAAATLNYDFGGFALTSVTSYQTLRTELVTDITRQFVPILAFFGRDYSAISLPEIITTKKFTQEVRLASQGDRPLEWQIGLFYTHERSEDVETFALRDPAGNPAPNDVFDYALPTTFQEYAAFGNLTYHLTDRFDISGGVRVARDLQRFEQFGAGLAGLITSAPLVRSRETVVTWLANARYRFNDRMIAYARYATGYRPGGPNYVGVDPATGTPLEPRTFDADTLQNYEVGFRAETADRTFSADLALFYIDWDDIQFPITINGFSVRTNAAGGASIRGAELTLSARPTPGFSIEGAFAFQDAHLDEADANLRARAGERLPNVPKFTASILADYEIRSSAARPSVGATLRFVSDREASFDAARPFRQFQLGDYATLDLRVGVHLDRFRVQVYVHNLFDSRGFLSAHTNRGTAQPAILQPRTIGISAATDF